MVQPRVGADRKVVQLHFGGGSPNFLSPEQIVRLGSMLHSRFDFADDAEMSVEIDPRTLTKAKVDAFVAMGINRASLLMSLGRRNAVAPREKFSLWPAKINAAVRM